MAWTLVVVIIQVLVSFMFQSCKCWFHRCFVDYEGVVLLVDLVSFSFKLHAGAGFQRVFLVTPPETNSQNPKTAVWKRNNIINYKP